MNVENVSLNALGKIFNKCQPIHVILTNKYGIFNVLKNKSKL